jgi:hypothetical protein
VKRFVYLAFPLLLLSIAAAVLTASAAPGAQHVGGAVSVQHCAKVPPRSQRRNRGDRHRRCATAARPTGTGSAAVAGLDSAPGVEPAPLQPLGPVPAPEPPPLPPPPPPVESEPGEGTAVPASAQAPERFFAPTSFWNTPVDAAAPLDPDSDEVVAALARQVAVERAAHIGPAITTREYSVPIYTVPADQPTVGVRLDSPYRAVALRAAWSAVPLPADAEPAAGRDHHLVVWQPSSDRLWEFWHLSAGAEGWQAGWGGAIQGVSESSGAYGPSAWPGASPTWGATASSLSLPGGLITLRDLERGRIDHALAMSVRDVRAQTFFAPALRTDGESTDPGSLPEGAHLRLDPSLDLATLGLPPLALMMAEAAQRYGIFIRDVAANVTFYAQDPVNVGYNPYLGEGGYFEGSYPQALLADFPWSRLQLLAAGAGS